MTRASLALAAVLAAVLFWRTPSRHQRTISEALAGLLALDVWRPLLATWPALYVGLFVAFYGLTTWTVVAVLAPGEPATGPAFAILAAGSGTALRFGATAALGRASFALALAAQALAALRFLTRRRGPDDAQRVALILVASSFADFAALWIAGDATRDWYVGRAISLATWIAIAADQTRALVRGRLEDRGG